jgi:hypothetical protein
MGFQIRILPSMVTVAMAGTVAINAAAKNSAAGISLVTLLHIALTSFSTAGQAAVETKMTEEIGRQAAKRQPKAAHILTTYPLLIAY